MDRVKVRRLTPAEGQCLQRNVCRGESKQGGNVVRWRRATILLASAGGNTVPMIARLVAADEDTVREVIHRFNDIGLDGLDPGGREAVPRQLTDPEENFVSLTTLTRPEKPGQPNTGWSVCKLGAYLREHAVIGAVPGREALRQVLHRHGITFQRTGTWKKSNDPEIEAKLEAIDDVLEHHRRPHLRLRASSGPWASGRPPETGGRRRAGPTSCRPTTIAPRA